MRLHVEPQVREARPNGREPCGCRPQWWTRWICYTLARHTAAIALAERYQFSVYDALIVASALDADCTTLLSEDMHDGLVIADLLTVQNPFRGVSHGR